MPILGIVDSAKTGNLLTTAFESIQTVTVGAGGQSTISFTSIPSTYTHLQLRGACRSSGTGGLNNVGTLMRFNNDTGGNYWWHEVFGTSTGPTGGSYGQSDSQIYIQPFSPDNGSASGIFGVNITDILDYANTNKFKVSKTLNGDDLNAANSGSQGGWVALNSGLWRNTSAINRIDIYMEGGTNLVQNSTYALYGVRG